MGNNYDIASELKDLIGDFALKFAVANASNKSLTEDIGNERRYRDELLLEAQKYKDELERYKAKYGEIDKVEE